MLLKRTLLAVLIVASGWQAAHAQSAPQTNGALVVVPAYGEIRQANDEARATFMVEEQDKDKTAAASRVNQKMREGTEIIRKADRSATLKTHGYYTYPVYNEEPQPRPLSNKARQIIGWRVGQYLEVTTTDLSGLPATVAAAQRVLALNGLVFGLTDATNRKLEETRIAAAYANLMDRITAVAKAMGRTPGDAVIDTIDFEASGAYAGQMEAMAPKGARAAAMSGPPVEEPSFEPGETTVGMRVVGKIRFK